MTEILNLRWWNCST